MKLLTLLLLIQVTPPAPIDVNRASKADLLTIEGITPTVADHIIRDRPYKTVEDVQGPVPRFLFEKIRTRITVTFSPITPLAITPQPRREIQVIRGNRIEKVQFEVKAEERPEEKRTEAPSDKSDSPQSPTRSEGGDDSK